MRRLLATAIVAAGALGMLGAQAAPGDNGTVVYDSGFGFAATSDTFTVDASTQVRGVIHSYSGSASITHQELVCCDADGKPYYITVTDWSGNGPEDSAQLSLAPGTLYTLALTSSGYGWVAAGSPE